MSVAQWVQVGAPGSSSAWSSSSHKPRRPARPPLDEAGRKRRAHTKSRRGCARCKLLRVKCDESKPSCGRCSAAVFSCHYGPPAPSSSRPPSSLSPSASNAQLLHACEITLSFAPAAAVAAVAASIRPPPSPPRLSIPLAGDTGFFYTISRSDEGLIAAFHRHTSLTLSTTSGVKILQPTFARLGPAQPFLVHAFLTLALLHETYRSLRAGLPAGCTAARANLQARVAFHYYHAIALLSRNLGSLDTEMAWAATALAAFAAFAISDPAAAPFPRPSAQASWPLRSPPSPADLSWMSLLSGKAAVLGGRPGSDAVLARILASPEYLADYLDAAALGQNRVPVADMRRTLPDGLVELCGLRDGDENDENGGGAGWDANPYATGLSILSQLRGRRCDQSSVLSFLSFVHHLDRRLVVLLRRRERRALVLLALSYAALLEYDQWWLRLRLPAELEALCLYLEAGGGAGGGGDGEALDGDQVSRLLEGPRRALYRFRLEEGSVSI